MRFILSKANFSGTGKNIGTLNSWFISKNTPSGLTWTSIPSSVDKGSNFNAVAEIDTVNYELVTMSVTMGTTTQSGVGTSGGITISKSGSQYTITISSVTANVNISVTTKNLSTGTPDSGGSSGGGGTGGNPGGSGGTSNYTLIHGNKYSSGNEANTARASISPLTIVVPKGVTITNKSTIKWAYYTNVNINNMPSGSGNGSWGDYTYTGTGAAIGISFKKTDDSAFDWSVDSTNPADYFDVSDEGLWNGTAEDITNPEPSTPEGTLGDITAITLVNGNPYGSVEQQTVANRAHGETALYAPAGTVISCKDTTTYKWALRRVKSETDLTDAGDGAYKPDSAWTTKTSYTTEKNGYWCFILLKASNANFDWNVDSNQASHYFTVS